MNRDRKLAIAAGVLFITATAAGVLSVPLSAPVEASDSLAALAANETQLTIAALLQMAMGFAGAGIAMALYPVLRRYNEALAVGAVAFRLMEGMFFVLGAGALLAVLSLSQAVVPGGAADVAAYQASAMGLLALRDAANLVLGALAFCTGALLYYIVFYQSRLIPRWLAGWGLAAASLHLVAVLLVMGGTDPFSPVTLLLNLPIFLNELVLAGWLIVKGFAEPVAVPAQPERPAVAQAPA